MVRNYHMRVSPDFKKVIIRMKNEFKKENMKLSERKATDMIANALGGRTVVIKKKKKKWNTK